MNSPKADWNQKNSVEVTEGRNGFSQVVLRNPAGSSIQISLHGGHISSWRTASGEELLFTTSKASFKPSKLAHGGILICFPRLGNCEILEQHGSYRNKTWLVEEDPPVLQKDATDHIAHVNLLLKPSPEDLKVWPHSFEFRLRVALSVEGDLSLLARVRNMNSKSFSFSFAYHAYLSVSDISEVRVEGLETLDYHDMLLQKEYFTEQGDSLTVESEVDRVYLGCSNDTAVFDHGKKRTFFLRKTGLPDIVVWNPWEKKAKSMSDFGNGEYKQMLCIGGAAYEKPVTLRSGEEWAGLMSLSLTPNT